MARIVPADAFMFYAVNSAKHENYSRLKQDYIDALPEPIIPAREQKNQPSRYRQIGLLAICKFNTMMNHQVSFAYWSMEYRNRLQRLIDGEDKEVTMTLRASKAFHKDGYRQSGRLIALALGHELLRRCRPELPVTWRSTDTALDFAKEWGLENADSYSPVLPSFIMTAPSVNSVLLAMHDNAYKPAHGEGIRTLHEALQVVCSPRNFLNVSDLPAPADPAYYRAAGCESTR